MQAPRTRTVHPRDAADARLARLPLEAERTYIYLRCFVDDHGRVEDNPAMLHGLLWSRHDRDVTATENDLAELTKAGLICRYAVGEQAYLHYPAWASEQVISRRTASDIPPCPVHEQSIEALLAAGAARFADRVEQTVSGLADRVGERIGDRMQQTAAGEPPHHFWAGLKLWLLSA